VRCIRTDSGKETVAVNSTYMFTMITEVSGIMSFKKWGRKSSDEICFHYIYRMFIDIYRENKNTVHRIDTEYVKVYNY
jgi:hypothetical protein